LFETETDSLPPEFQRPALTMPYLPGIVSTSSKALNNQRLSDCDIKVRFAAQYIVFARIRDQSEQEN
jgi:hypothetical protein